MELVGRDDDLAELGQVLRRPDLVGAFLVGPAGVGKTRLLEGAASRAAEQGFEVVSIVGSHASAELPLWAFARWMSASSAEPSTERLLAVRAALVEQAGGRPLLLAVDDAHLLDDTSALLLGQLARELVAFVVCTVRSGEPVPDPISCLWRQGVAAELVIRPLAREDVDQMAVELLGGPLDDGLVHELWQRSEGNPFFLRELILGSRSSGALTEHDGRWVRSAPLIGSAALVELVRSRIDGLSEAEVAALECVALSEPVGVRVIEEVADPDALVSLEEGGMLDVYSDGNRLTVRLSHPMYGDVVRAGMSKLRARRVRRGLARCITSFGARRQADTLAVASWRLDDAEPDVDLFLRAATEATSCHDVELAERFARSAHVHAPDLRTTHALAMALFLSGQHDDAIAVIDEAGRAGPAGPADDARSRARLDLLAALVLARGVGDYVRADEVLTALLEREPDPVTRIRADAMRAAIDLLRGRPAEALDRAQALLDVGIDVPDVATVIVGSLAATGRPVAALDAATAFVSRHGEPPANQLFDDFRTMALIEAGRSRDHDTVMVEKWEDAVERGDRHLQARVALALGVVAIEHGRLPLARQWLGRSAAMARLTGERYGERWAVGAELLAAAQSQDVEGATALLARLDAVPGHPAYLFEVYGERGRAWLAAITGNPEQARNDLLELADRLLDDHNVAHATHVLCDVARLGAPKVAAGRLRSLGSPIDGDLLPLLHEFVDGLAASDGPGLARAAERFELLGLAGLAAEAANSARDGFARAGLQREAAQWARQTQRLMALSDGVATPLVLLRDIELVAPLTRREREIAVLVAEGRTSREVADACFVSARTVDNHLAKIYDKLGVRSRLELRDALAPMMVSA